MHAWECWGGDACRCPLGLADSGTLAPWLCAAAESWVWWGWIGAAHSMVAGLEAGPHILLNIQQKRRGNMRH